MENKAAQLEKELEELRRGQEINRAQNRLFETFIRQARSSSTDTGVLSLTMHKVMDTMIRFSRAQKASLFLLDQSGEITESILARRETKGAQRSSILSAVFDKGLAGWVKTHLRAGLVKDTKKDHRWYTLPGAPYKVRSALAVPLFRHQELFGIITLMHAQPKQFDEQTAELIQQMANQLSLVIENAKLYTELERSRTTLEEAKVSIEKYSAALDDELERGQAIQKKFMPQSLPEFSQCDIAVRFHSALHLSGDFFDIFTLPNRHVGMVTGDVSGKGVGSSLFMALTRSLLRIFSGAATEPSPKKEDSFTPEQALAAINMTNGYIAREHSQDYTFISMFFGILHQPTGKFDYINAGNEPALVLGPDGIKDILMPTGPVVGLFEDSVYKSGHRLLAPEDIIISYTDGVTEARSPDRTFYTRDRLTDLLKNGGKHTADGLLEQIETDLMAFVGDAPRSDDITMLAMKWIGS